MSENNEVHTYTPGSGYTRRPRTSRLTFADGRAKCDSPTCDGTCDAGERKNNNDGAEGFLRRLRGASE